MQEAVATIPAFAPRGQLPRKPKLIYVLSDPRDGAVRYVGITTRTLRDRLEAHISAGRKRTKTAVRSWVRSLELDGIRPNIRAVDRLSVDADWAPIERWWITLYRASGARLLNLTMGGDGTHGYKHSAETRRLIGQSRIGYKHSPETLAKMSAALKGRKPSPQTLAAIPAGGKKRMGTNNHRARAVIVDGIRFETVGDAARHCGIHHSSLIERIQKGRASYATD